MLSKKGRNNEPAGDFSCIVSFLAEKHTVEAPLGFIRSDDGFIYSWVTKNCRCVNALLQQPYPIFGWIT